MEVNETETDKTGQAEPITDKITIPVVQEEIILGKKVVETGKVRISKKISEHQETVNLPLFHEDVSVERVAVNKIIDSPPSVRQEGDITIIPVLEEQIVVQKQLVLVEELHVKRRIVETTHNEEVLIRKENVYVERD